MNLCTAPTLHTQSDNAASPSPPHSKSRYLPLGLLARQERLQNPDLLIQRLQPDSQPLMHRRLVGAQLDVEVLPVGTRGHGGAEDGLHEEGVVRLQGGAVGVAEGDGELVSGDVEVGGESQAGEFKTAGGKDVSSWR